MKTIDNETANLYKRAIEDLLDIQSEYDTWYARLQRAARDETFDAGRAATIEAQLNHYRETAIRRIWTVLNVVKDANDLKED